ncbi:hypothetical protein QYM36_014189 [Artemia franciscana]|uniref:Laminin subunit alpha n=1 Tax=Artemia franciscana TaxID=6661 RepID=A0AA88KXT9_ARTSF|nr:hypothetical protein QYM36_014189 [Artemia franciscana]
MGWRTKIICILGWIYSCKCAILTPPYFNLATGRRIAASATCGEGVTDPELYCKLVGGNANNLETNYDIIQGQLCDYCDPNDPLKSHPPENAIDGRERWWQSPPMSRGLKYGEVNLTIDLGQEFHVAYIFIRMGNSPRPGAWVLERSVDNGNTYEPWQFFAESDGDCAALFGQETLGPIYSDDAAVCVTQFSKILPLEDGEIVVSLLNNRPSANDFFNSSVLQEWTKATNIRLRFLRAKTLFGQLMNAQKNDPTVTRRFFYSIRDISIGGRCVCNGHASTCDVTDPREPYKLLCNCQHNTCGAQCEYCCPGFVQKKWKQSKAGKPFVCEPCNCFGHSDECEYDEEIDRERRSLDIEGNYEGGGVCQNCRDNTEGVNCDRCKSRYFRPFGRPLNATDVCEPCACDVFYSTGNCAEGSGKCECRKEFEEPDCDRCSFGYFGYPDCRPCECSINGTRVPVCEVGGGQCPCKENYAGKACDQCAEGYYNYPECIPCECDSPGSVSEACEFTTGQCECSHNFAGRTCNQCEHGFFNFPDCQYCTCDPRGTTEEICDKNSGECQCKEGYDGARCDRCKPGYFGYPDCKPCDCHDAGSAGAVCSPNGQCPCLPNYSGRACDKCSPGYFKFPECKSCNCDFYGSLGSACDDEGVCQCKPNFNTDKCDVCREHFYNYPACEECNCDPAGVVDSFAGCGSVPKGELCACKERVEGRICNKCRPLFWNLQKYNPLGCEDCNCNAAGTAGGLRVCDTETGDCPCKKNVYSRQCDFCKDGTFNLQEDNVFGCTDCSCNPGGSILSTLVPHCDKISGQCTCRPRVMGRACDEPLQLHYFPTLHQMLFEAEDGYTPASRSAPRYAYDENQFPNYSWRGYAVYSNLQQEISYDIEFEKPMIYRVIFHYINPNSESIPVKVSLISDNQNSEEQVFVTKLESTRYPRHTTFTASGGIPAPFVIQSPGTWTATITSEKPLLMDYFVMLPSAYYEASVLQQRVANPCSIAGNGDLCKHYSYPSLSSFDAIRGEAAYVDDGETRSRAILFDDYSTLQFLDLSRASVINENQPEIHLDMRLQKPGRYVLVISYFTPLDGRKSNVQLDISSGQERFQGQAVLYDCTYSFPCKQIVTTEDGQLGIYPSDNYLSLVLRGDEGANTAIDSVSAIPAEEWNLDFINLSPVCTRKDGKCIGSTYPNVPDSSKIEFEPVSLDEEEEELEEGEPHHLPDNIFDATTGLVYLDEGVPMVDVTGKVSSQGYYVFIAQYYQPNHPEVKLDVILQNGQFYEAHLPLKHCPSVSGCRAVLEQANGDFKFNILESFVFSAKNPTNKGVWLDYLYVVPVNQYTHFLLEESPVDLTNDFFKHCTKNQYFILPENATDFCKKATFTLTTEFNNGALPCGCDIDGSLSFECAKFGGQCECRPNVIGRQCTRCKTGYYGFPDCKICDCPSTAYCEPTTGQCICPPHVTGPRCDRCEPLHYGYDPLIGCEACECNPLGVYDGNLQCDLENGQCDCKQNVVGRTCDRCESGYWAFPQCQLCNCDVRGTLPGICNQDTAECFCKENVVGSSCDLPVPGAFNLLESNPNGATKCFCFGKATICNSAPLFWNQEVNMEGWSSAAFLFQQGMMHSRSSDVSVEQFDLTIRAVLIDWLPEMGVFYFSAPQSYLGNKLSSYGGLLNYTVVFVEGPRSSAIEAPDIIFTGGTNLTLVHSMPKSIVPGVPTNVLVELTEHNFVLPSGLPVNREQFMILLHRLEGIYIRGSYFEPIREVRITRFSMNIATEDYELNLEPAYSVEKCNCPVNYLGLSCEDCAPGYFRAQTGPFGGFCVPCQCNGHADTCDVDTGKCFDCKHNTIGDNCDMCVDGYYGDATVGTPNDCLICACPLPLISNNFASSCSVSSNGLNIDCFCKPEYTGPYCETCSPGYFGQPMVAGDFCKPCNCSGNIDPSDPNSCDSVTGECLKCLGNSYGEGCSVCEPGYYGDAIYRKDCQSCECDACGTEECDHYSGECRCKPNVEGGKCDRCSPDHYGFSSCEGCRPCDCGVASESSQCDDITGQCQCKPGVTGKNCERCAAGYWNYGPEGCVSCNCNTEFSIGASCNPQTGQCECLPGVIGEKCERCPYRWVLIPEYGCEECDSCHHSLLDVTDDLQRMIGPVQDEFRYVALSHFTKQRLLSLNETANTLAQSVALLDPNSVIIDPLQEGTEEVGTTARSTKSRTDSVAEQAELMAYDGKSLLDEILKEETNIQDTVLRTEEIVSEVSIAAEGFGADAGPAIEQASAEADATLQELQSRTFEQRTKNAKDELKEAEDLLQKINEFVLPTQLDSDFTGRLKKRQVDLEYKLEDLRNHSVIALEKANNASLLIQKLSGSPTLIGANDIRQKNKTATSQNLESSEQVEETSNMLEKAQSNFDSLNLENERLRGFKDTFGETIDERERNLREVLEPVEEAKLYADDLLQQANNLDGLLGDTRTTSENAVKAANSYSDIVDAIQEAAKAAQEANEAALSASSYSDGVGERSASSLEAAQKLKDEADDLQNKMLNDVQPRLDISVQQTDDIDRMLVEAGDKLADAQNAIEQLPVVSKSNEVQDSKARAENSGRLAEEALQSVDQISVFIPAKVEAAKNMSRDLDNAGKSAVFLANQVGRVASEIPAILSLADMVTQKENVLRPLGTDVGDLLRELKQKIAVAHDNANRIPVGVSFKPNTVLELRPPEDLENVKTSTTMSLFFRTNSPDGFLAYLGNEIGASKKMKRVLSDDYMALEILDGYLTLTADFGSGPQTVRSDVRVDDNQWYQAVVNRNGKAIKLIIKTEGEAGKEFVYPKEVVLPGSSSALNIQPDTASIYIGGYPETAKIQPGVRYSSFEGEIEEFSVNDKPIGLWNFKDAAGLDGALERDKLKELNIATGYRFDSDSYVVLSGTQYRVRGRMNIQLRFKTFADDGLLFLCGNRSEFLSLDIQNGKVRFQYNLGSGPVIIESSDAYNDGEWHVLEASRAKRNGLLKIDGQIVSEGASPGQQEELSVSEYFYVGGYLGSHQYDSVSKRSFDGCIDDVVITGTNVDLSQNLQSYNVLPGCPDKVASVISFPENSDGFVSVPGVNLESFVEVNLKLRSNEKDGVLFYIADEDQSNSISLAIVDGALVLRSGGGEVLTPMKYTDDSWHVVTATRDHGQLRLDIDDYDTFTANITGPPLQITANPIYFGGIPESVYTPDGALAIRQSYAGCLGDVTINGKIINFADAAQTKSAVIGSCGGKALEVPPPSSDFQIPVFEGDDIPSGEENLGETVLDYELPPPERPLNPEDSIIEEDNTDETTSGIPLTVETNREVTFDVTEKLSTSESSTTPPSSPSYEEEGTTFDFDYPVLPPLVEEEEKVKKPQPKKETFPMTEKPVVDDKGPIRGDAVPELEDDYDYIEETTRARVITVPSTTTTTEAPKPVGQCKLPIRPAGDPDINSYSGFRFGNTRFSRQEYQTLPARPRAKSSFSVEFKTVSPDGIIFYSADQRHIDFIALYLRDGKIHYSFNCGSGAGHLASPLDYADGDWHMVTFSREAQNGTLIVDGDLVAEGMSRGNTRSINIDPPFFVGGISPEAVDFAKGNMKGLDVGFVGCLRDFRMNDRPLTDLVTAEGVEPCSSKVEEGSFFSIDGGYIKAYETFRVGLDIDISMEIKPRSMSGILMAVHGRRDYLVLQIVNGTVIFIVDNGRGAISSSYTPPHEHYLCDGQWHSIQAIKTRNVVTLSVDNVFVEPGIGAVGVSSTDTNHPLYIGGHPNPIGRRGIQTSEQYVGCLRRLVVDETEQKLYNAVVVGSVTTTTCPTI